MLLPIGGVPYGLVHLVESGITLNCSDTALPVGNCLSNFVRL